jgi:CO dehydrogenase maturation factor
MSYFIAITGKGGTGKTTIAALLVKQLIEYKCKPILAVDADPNTCLDIALGVTATRTLGRAREETKELASQGIAAGVSKQRLLEAKISECLVEASDFDLIAMGRPEGPGCYCYANNVLKEVLSQISLQYPFVILDNEAGLENLSRRIVQKVDLLIFVADPSSQGLKTVKRLFELAQEMNIQYGKLAIIINRLSSELQPIERAELLKATNADWVIDLPENTELAKLGRNSHGIWPISVNNPVVVALNQLLLNVGIGNQRRESSL